MFEVTNTFPFFKIESDVKPPEKYKVAPNYKYPFNQMKIKDSFEFDSSLANRVSAASCTYAKVDDTGKKFTVRKQDGGKHRIWRIL